MTEREMAVFGELQTIAKDCQISYKLEEKELSSDQAMNIDSLEFMTLLIEIQDRFGLQIPDEVVAEKNLRVIKNLVNHLSDSARASA